MYFLKQDIYNIINLCIYFINNFDYNGKIFEIMNTLFISIINTNNNTEIIYYYKKYFIIYFLFKNLNLVLNNLNEMLEEDDIYPLFNDRIIYKFIKKRYIKKLFIYGYLDIDIDYVIYKNKYYKIFKNNSKTVNKTE